MSLGKNWKLPERTGSQLAYVHAPHEPFSRVDTELDKEFNRGRKEQAYDVLEMFEEGWDLERIKKHICETIDLWDTGYGRHEREYAKAHSIDIKTCGGRTASDESK